MNLIGFFLMEFSATVYKTQLKNAFLYLLHISFTEINFIPINVLKRNLKLSEMHILTYLKILFKIVLK